MWEIIDKNETLLKANLIRVVIGASKLNSMKYTLYPCLDS